MESQTPKVQPQVPSLRAINILLFNFYTILLIQLLFNWSRTNCEHSTSVWKVIFLSILFARLFLDEASNNGKIPSSSNLNKYLKLGSAFILAGMGIIMIVILASHKADFDDFNRTGVCSLVRIEYAFDIGFAFFILIKDVSFLLLSKEQSETTDVII